MSNKLAMNVVDGIGVIRLDNPPVNAWSFDQRRAFVETYSEFCADDSVDVIVVTGTGKLTVAAINGIALGGGPMQYADEIGVARVLEGMNKYREQLGDYGDMWFRPSPLLEQIAMHGESFSSQ